MPNKVNTMGGDSFIWDPTAFMLQSNEKSKEIQMIVFKEATNSEELMEVQDVENCKEGNQVCKNIPEDKIVVHGRMGPYLLDKNKWPRLSLPNETEIESQIENIS
jgi:hypothetical protein